MINEKRNTSFGCQAAPDNLRIYVSGLTPEDADLDDARYTTPAIDWNEVIQSLDNGFRVFNPRHLRSGEFVSMISRLEEEYARECFNVLANLDGEEICKELSSYRDPTLANLEEYVLELSQHHNSLMQYDDTDHANGVISDEEHENVRVVREGMVSAASRVLAAIDEECNRRLKFGTGNSASKIS